MIGRQTALAGWGRYPVATSLVFRPETLSDLSAVLRAVGGRSVLARGAGRSYGDAALNPDGTVVDIRRLNRMLAFDEHQGVLRCEAGVTMAEVLDVFVPRGWFPSVTPGTRFVTAGGAVAGNVHGKNHHRDGSIATFVDSITLMLASGEMVTCSRQVNPDLFQATVGGMGLTGVITEIQWRLRPIESAFIQCRTIKAPNLEQAIAAFEEYDASYQYSVAWIDCLAGGREMGRSIILFGNHAPLAGLDPSRRQRPLRLPGSRTIRVPLDSPAGLLNGVTLSVFNALYYRLHPARPHETLEDLAAFFYPLDAIRDWNRLYGPRGFVQYQFVLPLAAGLDGLREILSRSRSQGRGSFLAVLKRFGPREECFLAFPMEGYTVALDMPVRAGLWDFLKGLDRIVLDHGGRVYLGKDARLDPDAFHRMYPRLADWQRVKASVDPDNVFSSAMSRRLRMPAASGDPRMLAA